MRQQLRDENIFRHILKLAVLMVAAAALQSCAIRQAPPGGPEDKTPPKVLHTYPPPDSIGIQQLAYLEVEFDEPIDRSSLRNQIWMMPELPGGYEVKWKGGRKLRIQLNDTLDANQTYIVNIGNGVKDYRNNRLESPVVLTFSTGTTIDRGEISGTVAAEKIESTYILAYPMDEDFHPSMIFSEKPRYYTQPAKDGSFKIGYLKAGTYRVFALDDRNRDRVYAIQTDMIGFPSEDVRLDSAQMAVERLNFTLVREDTLPPKIARARSAHQNLVEIQFTEDIQPDSHLTVSITDSATGQPLTVYSAEVDAEVPNRILVFSEAQREVVYHGGVAAFYDKFGNHGTGDFRFTGRAKEDTAATRHLKISPANGASGLPFDARLEVTFSHPLDTATFYPNVIVQRADSQAVPGDWRFPHLRRGIFAPASPWENNTSYTVILKLPQMRSVFQKPFGDTLITSQFTAADIAQLGEISGVIATPESKGQAILLLTAESDKTEYSYVVPVNEPYLASNLPDGFYRMRATWDINSNGKVDAGSSLPFEFAEPFRLFTDTLKVRKRWTTGGINLEF